MPGKRRPRGEGSIFQRKDGKWVATVSLGHDQEGRRIRRDLYGKTRAEVVRKLADERARAGGRIIAKPTKGTVGELVAEYLATISASREPTTAATYRSVWRSHGEPLVGSRKLAAFGPNDVSWHFSTLTARGIGGAAIAKLRVVLHAAFADARLRGAFHGPNPFDLVKPPRHRPKERQALTLEQARRFLAAAKGDRFEAAFVLAVTLGLRRGEILGLRWDDADLDARTLSVRRSLQEVAGKFTISAGKTKTATRRLTLGDLALDALRRRRKDAEAEGHGSPFIFTTTLGTHVSASALRSRHYKPMLERAYLPDVPFHALRHSFASLLLGEGVPLKVVSEAIGHADPSFTAKQYQHVLGDLQGQAIRVLDAALKQPRKRSK